MLSIQHLEAISLAQYVHPLKSAYCTSVSHNNDLLPPPLPKTHIYFTALPPEKKNFLEMVV